MVLSPSKIVQKVPISKATSSEEAEAYVSTSRVASANVAESTKSVSPKAENAAGGLFQRFSFAETKGPHLPGRNPAIIKRLTELI